MILFAILLMSFGGCASVGKQLEKPSAILGKNSNVSHMLLYVVVSVVACSYASLRAQRSGAERVCINCDPVCNTSRVFLSMPQWWKSAGEVFDNL